MGLPLDFTVSFTEPLPLIDAAIWSWGDGDTTTCAPGSADYCTLTPGNGTPGTLASSHAYSEPGVYVVQVTMEDIHGQSDTTSYEYVVVYDPGGGFVTGGGWIDSPAGAYAPDPTLTGQATFGFVSRYKRGSSRPTGNTEFKFKVADLKFFSDTYDWLVVNRSGSNAQFKGSGTINGASAPTGEDYRFMIWAADGSASDTADTFRIRIWYEDGDLELVVYDNGGVQPIGGGNITVHKPSKKK